MPGSNDIRGDRFFCCGRDGRGGFRFGGLRRFWSAGWPRGAGIEDLSFHPPGALIKFDQVVRPLSKEGSQPVNELALDDLKLAVQGNIKRVSNRVRQECPDLFDICFESCFDTFGDIANRKIQAPGRPRG